MFSLALSCVSSHYERHQKETHFTKDFECTFAIRFSNSPPLVSVAMLRRPYWRVSWRPRLPAVSLMDAVLICEGGTIRYEGS